MIIILRLTYYILLFRRLVQFRVNYTINFIDRPLLINTVIIILIIIVARLWFRKLKYIIYVI